MGPLLFLLYINDLPQHVTSEVRLFTDDCLLFRAVRTPEPHKTTIYIHMPCRETWSTYMLGHSHGEWASTQLNVMWWPSQTRNNHRHSYARSADVSCLRFQVLHTTGGPTVGITYHGHNGQGKQNTWIPTAKPTLLPQTAPGIRLQ